MRSWLAPCKIQLFLETVCVNVVFSKELFIFHCFQHTVSALYSLSSVNYEQKDSSCIQICYSEGWKTVGLQEHFTIILKKRSKKCLDDLLLLKTSQDGHFIIICGHRREVVNGSEALSDTALAAGVISLNHPLNSLNHFLYPLQDKLSLLSVFVKCIVHET